jgi:hypothetical protein
VIAAVISYGLAEFLRNWLPRRGRGVASQFNWAGTMPIRHERDDVRRRVVLTVQGTPEPDDALAVITRQYCDDAWSYALLSDLRSLTGLLTLRKLRPIFGRASQGNVAARPGSGREVQRPSTNRRRDQA